MDDFEQELRRALERRLAPLSLKRKVMERRRWRRMQLHGHAALWQRLAASLLLVAVLGGAWKWRQAEEERRRGEAAREQVLTALRITSHALDEVNSRLAAHDRAGQE
jgi:hypothetical protein